MKKTILLLIILLPLFSYSQVTENFHVKAFRAENYSNQVSLFIKGDKNKIQEYVKSHNGVYKYSSNGYHSITINGNLVQDLLSQDFVIGTDFTLHRPYALNDTMRVRDNVNPVHAGQNPLDTSYTGKGVVIGVIDTGIDFNHPDFQFANGKTRIVRWWDQSLPFDAQRTPPYGYGQVWDSTDINLGNCTSVDQGNAHGTTVTGTAAGNGLANGRHKGVAPDATLVMVTSDFSAGNWLATVADATDYIYKVADSLGLPCVINASIGDYYGSHDGHDPAALFIDSLINAKPGRLFISAAGNSGNIGNYHVRHDSNINDTTFTWFTYNPSTYLGYGAIFFEGYADTAALNDVSYSIGANLPSGSFSDRGRTAFIKVADHLGTTHSEPIMNGGNVIGNVDFYVELQGDVYLLQVHVQEPDSSNYLFRFMTTGNGAMDIWSTSIFGTSNMKETGLPSAATLPSIVNYASPDSSKIIVSSFSCGQNTLLVGNYYAMQSYTDYNSNLQVLGGTNGQISINSSRGPSRDLRVKPEITASGDVHMSAAPLSMIANMIISEPFKVDEGGMHIRNGGTSMAAPVVTGIGALALEKCPLLTSGEFRDMMINSAKTDLFTGTIPNMSYGYGKADAFNTLVESNFSPAVTLNTSLCPNDSVELQIGPGPFYNYVWNTGDTTSTIWATDSVYFSVSVNNQFGCKGKLDSIQTSVYPLNIPTITIDTMGGLLLSSQGLTYQWLFEGDTLVGETNNTLDFTSIGNGTYEVFITDANGCMGMGFLYLTVAGIDELLGNSISIYPNPASNYLTISSKENKIISIKITDVSGRLIQNYSNINSENYVVDLSKNSRSIYFLIIETESGLVKKRVVRD